MITKTKNWSPLEKPFILKTGKQRKRKKYLSFLLLKLKGNTLLTKKNFSL